MPTTRDIGFNPNAAASLLIFVGSVMATTAAALSFNPVLFSALASADEDVFVYLNGTFNPDPTVTAQTWFEGFTLGLLEYKYG